jgi:hypothetical protein
MERRRSPYLNATAIVCDLQELETAILDEDLYRGGPSIDCVLNELFQGMYGSHNDFSGRNLVDHVEVKRLRQVSDRTDSGSVAMNSGRCRVRFTLIRRAGRAASSGGSGAFLLVPATESTSILSLCLLPPIF